MVEEKKRIEWIDVLRGTAIILVLLGHNNPPFVNYIYGFHIPLFFIISGFLYHDCKVSTQIWKVIKRFYIDYIVLCILNGIIYEFVIMLESKSKEFNWMAIIKNIKGILIVDEKGMNGCFPLWFLPVLAISEIAFLLIMQIKNRYVRIGIIAVISLFGFAFNNYQKFIPFRIHVAAVGILFLGVGYCLKQLNLFKKNNIIFMLCLIVGFLAIFFNSSYGRQNMSDARYGNVFLFVIGAITWSYAIMYIFEKIVPEREELGVFKALKYIGKNTIFLMTFDEMTNILGGQTIDETINIHIWYVDFIVRALIMSISFLLYKLLCKGYMAIRNN